MGWEEVRALGGSLCLKGDLGQGHGRGLGLPDGGGTHLQRLPVPAAPGKGVVRQLCKQAGCLHLQVPPPEAPTGRGSSHAVPHKPWCRNWECKEDLRTKS